MKTVELFSGTQSFSKVMREQGHETFCVDNNPDFDNDLTIDLLDSDTHKLLWSKIDEADIVWISFPCTSFSMASGNTHWTADKLPKTQTAKDGLYLLNFSKYVARRVSMNKKVFFLENPNGRAVWFLPDEWLKRVWYCQYGHANAKPTNIWTNLNVNFKTCKRYIKGKPKHCHHEPAPRGSKTGTQGLKNNMERSVIPPQLFYAILDHMKKLDLT